MCVCLYAQTITFERNDLHCVESAVKLQSTNQPLAHIFSVVCHLYYIWVKYIGEDHTSKVKVIGEMFLFRLKVKAKLGKSVRVHCGLGKHGRLKARLN